MDGNQPLSRKRVIIYRDHLLPFSETFIQAQAAALERYEPVFAGSRRVTGLDLGAVNPIVANSGDIRGSIEELSLKLLGRAPRFTMRLRRLRPVLVHAHFGPDALRALPIVQRLHVPLIATCHGFEATMHDSYADASFYGHRRYRRYRDRLFSGASRIIAVSNFLRGALIRQGCPPERIDVLYIGVDTSLFCPTDADRSRKILFVGRLVDVKGCSHLLRAAKRLAERGIQFEVTIVGDGPLRRELEELSANLGLGACVKFLGSLPPAKVRSHMARARLLCVPSVTAASGASEALGMVFLEAQAMALPVVSYAHGGIPEAVLDGTTGLLAPEGNIGALAERLELVLQSDETHSRLARAGPPHIRANFELRSQTRRLEGLYDEVIGAMHRNAEEA